MSGFSGSGFGQKAAPSQKSGNQWQKSTKPQSTLWHSQTKPSTTAKPNYSGNFGVIGGREERGVRTPSFGKFSEGITYNGLCEVRCAVSLKLFYLLSFYLFTFRSYLV